MAKAVNSDAVEIWKPVLEWEGLYEVSSFGRVRSLDRKIHRKNGHSMTHRGKMLRPTANTGRGGRLSVHMRDSDRSIRREVHVLVCQAFHGAKPSPKMVAAHWDGDVSNNSAVNLRWATQVENMDDARRHGTLWCGGSNRRPAISAETKGAVMEDIRRGVSVPQIIQKHGVSHSAAYRLKRAA